MDVFGKFGGVLLKGVGFGHLDEFASQGGLIVHIVVDGMSSKSISGYGDGVIVFHVFVILSVCGVGVVCYVFVIICPPYNIHYISFAAEIMNIL